MYQIPPEFGLIADLACKLMKIDTNAQILVQREGPGVFLGTRLNTFHTIMIQLQLCLHSQLQLKARKEQTHLMSS